MTPFLKQFCVPVLSHDMAWVPHNNFLNWMWDNFIFYDASVLQLKMSKFIAHSLGFGIETVEKEKANVFFYNIQSTRSTGLWPYSHSSPFFPFVASSSISIIDVRKNQTYSYHMPLLFIHIMHPEWNGISQHYVFL